MTGVAQTDDYFASIVDDAFEAIISKNLDGQIMSWNKAAERLFGWPAEDMIGDSIRRIIPEDRQQEEDDVLARVRAGELVPKFETVRQRKDGKLIPVALTISPIRSAAGDIVGASKFAHDISDDLRLRSQLVESEARFHSLAENIPQLAWMADSEGWIFWYNQRWFDYTGTTLADMEGWGWTKVHHPDHVDGVIKRIQKSWDSGTPWEDTFPLLGADGKYRWFLSRALPIRDERGEIRCWFGTNTDVTQQRDNERQIEILMGELNHRSKNMLTVIQGIARRTLAPAGRPFLDAFERRLSAIGANLDLLTQRGWTGAAIGDVIHSQLSHFQELVGDRIQLLGASDIVLNRTAAEVVGLAIHELATNAGKYGALSNDVGKVLIECGFTDDRERLYIAWRESGGPVVKPPAKTGFGSVVISKNPRLSLSAKIELEYPAEGLKWRLDAPAERLIDGASE